MLYCVTGPASVGQDYYLDAVALKVRINSLLVAQDLVIYAMHTLIHILLRL